MQFANMHATHVRGVWLLILAESALEHAVVARRLYEDDDLRDQLRGSTERLPRSARWDVGWASRGTGLGVVLALATSALCPDKGLRGMRYFERISGLCDIAPRRWALTDRLGGIYGSQSLFILGVLGFAIAFWSNHAKSWMDTLGAVCLFSLAAKVLWDMVWRCPKAQLPTRLVLNLAIPAKGHRGGPLGSLYQEAIRSDALDQKHAYEMPRFTRKVLEEMPSYRNRKYWEVVYRRALWNARSTE